MEDIPEIPPVGEIETPKGIFNAANRGSVKEREKARKLREEGKSDALAKLLSSQYGRAWVYDMLVATGFWDQGVSATYNSNEMWARVGMRRVALDLNEAAWRASPAGYNLMMDENRSSP